MATFYFCDKEQKLSNLPCLQLASTIYLSKNNIFKHSNSSCKCILRGHLGSLQTSIVW
jgi:hypothetical protein